MRVSTEEIYREVYAVLTEYVTRGISGGCSS